MAGPTTSRRRDNPRLETSSPGDESILIDYCAKIPVMAHHAPVLDLRAGQTIYCGVFHIAFVLGVITAVSHGTCTAIYSDCNPPVHQFVQSNKHSWSVQSTEFFLLSEVRSGESRLLTRTDSYHLPKNVSN